MIRKHTVVVQINYEPLPLEKYKEAVREVESFFLFHGGGCSPEMLRAFIYSSINREKQLIALLEMVEGERDRAIAGIRR